MKTLTQFVAALVVVILSSACALRAQDAPPPPPSPDDQGQAQGQADQGDDQSASFQTFYDQLGDQGTWVQTDDYGYVFQPNVTDPNWAPYTDGHWVYTDEGWTWVSDESWGWATYHYGRWINIDGTGWVWVPGYRWAPAWVSWRYGDGYCGWAPLPPETFEGAEYGGDGGWASFHFGGDVDVSFGIGAGYYNFVRVGDMGERNYRGHYLDRSRNYAIINRTTNITNINVAGGAGRGGFRGVSVGGPTLAEVNAHSRTHVATVQLAAANQAGRSNLQGNTLAVYAPRVNPATLHQSRPTNVGQTLTHPTFNRGNSVTRPLAVTSTLRPAAASPEAVQAAQTAQLHAPASARIAPANATVKPLSRPLTSMEPVNPAHNAASVAAPSAGSVNSNAVHPSASSPFTGEPANKPAEAYHPESAPTSTYHPQAEQKPAATYHPESAPAPTYHPQAEQKPAATYHPESTPAPTYHPQAEEKPAPTYHPESAPAPASHPQAEEKPAESYHPQSAPAPASHPQAQVTHEAAPQVHPQAAPAPASHPAAAPAAKPAPASGGNPNQQNH